MSGSSQCRRWRLRSARPFPAHGAARAALAALLLAAAGPAPAADPNRGALLFATPPAPGLLACADCHGADPQVNNFGNIWAGRNAVALIQRAVQSNTGGMGYFGGFYGSADFADIAAYLGNAPAALDFEPTEVGRDSSPRSLTIATSTKIGIDALQLRTEGDFVVAGSTCGASVPRFATCSVEVVFRPGAAGDRSGSLLIEHDGTPTPVRVRLSGMATARPAAIARLQPSRLDLSAAGPPGVQSASLLNDSGERLTVGAIAGRSGAFRWVGGSCRPGLVLQPGQRCEVAVRFDPPSGAAQTAALDVAHDGVGGRSSLALSGRVGGGGAAAVPAWLSADLPVADFGSVAAGAVAAAQTVNWRNAGTADWQWQATTLAAPGVRVLADGCRSAGLVAPGEACAVVLSFDPKRPGAISGRLLLQGRDGVPAAALPVSGRATAGTSVLVATPAGLSFGALIGQTVRRQLQLVVAGDAGVALASIGLTGADAARFALPAASGCAVGAVLAAATGCTLALEFSPARAGLHEASLRVQPAGGGAAIDVPLVAVGKDGSAAAAAAPVQADAARLDFVEQAVGAAAPPLQRVTLVNAGAEPWVAGVITTTGADAASFPLAGSCAPGLRVEVGAHCSVEVGFKPRAAGVHQATLLLLGADGGEPTAISLAGRAVATGVPRLQADTAWLVFPTLRTGGSATAQLIVGNHGSAPAGAPRWAIDGPFRVDRQSAACLAPLAPGARCTLELRFEPTTAGPASGRLRFGGAGSVALRGEAVDAPTPLLAWQKPPAAHSHGTAAVGAAPLASSVWTLVNRGDAATAPLALSLAGAHASDFSLDAAGSCRSGAVLAPRQACSLRVNFHPSAVGPRSATLRVQGGAAWADMPLAGRGRADALGLLQALPRSVSFDAAAAVPAGVFWHNDGPAALRVSSIGLRGDGFGLTDGTCPAAPFILQPGQACTSEVAWNGAAEARFGGELVARSEPGAPLAVTLTVVEDPALRSNVGGSGGGAFHGGLGAAWVLALALAGAVLRRAESRDA